MNQTYVEEAADLFYVKARVQSRGITSEGNALIDSASETCVMSTDFAKANDIDVEESNATISTVIGTSQAVGITKLLKLNVHGYKCNARFYVVDHKTELILGINWMQANNAGVLFTDGIPMVNINGANHSLDSFKKLKQVNHVQKQDYVEDDITMSEATVIHEEDDEDYEIGWDLEADAQFPIKSSIELNPEETVQFNKLVPKIKKTIATDLSQLGHA
jgi:hypothetical protein